MVTPHERGLVQADAIRDLLRAATEAAGREDWLAFCSAAKLICDLAGPLRESVTEILQAMTREAS